MEESLSFVVTFEGGQPFIQLVVLEGYLSQNRIMEIPFGLLDFQALVRSAQVTGDYWIVNTTADLPDFQVDSSIFVRHREGKILWDLIYEHYEPFLDVELEEDEEDEEVVTSSVKSMNKKQMKQRAKFLAIAEAEFEEEDEEED